MGTPICFSEIGRIENEDVYEKQHQNGMVSSQRKVFRE